MDEPQLFTIEVFDKCGNSHIFSHVVQYTYDTMTLFLHKYTGPTMQPQVGGELKKVAEGAGVCAMFRADELVGFRIEPQPKEDA